jgi:hypothetical protein
MRPGLVATEDRCCSPMHPGKKDAETISIDYDNLLCHKALHYFPGDLSFSYFVYLRAPLWF